MRARTTRGRPSSRSGTSCDGQGASTAGGGLTVDPAGNVYVAWHASEKDAAPGEAGHRVWVARSEDDGRTFAVERPAWAEPTGACGCCGMALSADRRGNVYALYRSPRGVVPRDGYLPLEPCRGFTHPWALPPAWGT